jgi:hypothetical protein
VSLPCERQSGATGCREIRRGAAAFGGLVTCGDEDARLRDLDRPNARRASRFESCARTRNYTLRADSISLVSYCGTIPAADVIRWKTA